MAKDVLKGFRPLYARDLLGPVSNAAHALAVAALLAVLVFGAPTGV
jgi:hypothetical protein